MDINDKRRKLPQQQNDKTQQDWRSLSSDLHLRIRRWHRGWERRSSPKRQIFTHKKKTNGSSIYKPSRFWHWKTMRRGRHRHIPTGKRLTKHCYVLCFTHTAAQNAETRVFRALNRIFSIFSGAWSTSNISWSSKLGGDQNHPKML